MPAESKMTFMNRFKQRMEKSFKASDIDIIMRDLSECLNGFDMETLPDIGKQKDDRLQIYIDALRIQGRSEKTVTRYQYILQRTLTSINVGTSEITVYHLRNFLSKEKARGLDDSTLDGYRQIYSAYLTGSSGRI